MTQHVAAGASWGEGGVPPGFESLMSPQESLVDIYYGGVLVVTTMAEFTPEQVTFLQPDDITLNIPDLLEPETVTRALTGPIDAHQQAICHYEGQADCGTLRPEAAAVIFNADIFRADVFVNPNMLAVRSLAVDKYLPASDAGWSYLQTFNYAFGGSSADIAENSNLFLLSALAYRENSLRMSANYIDQSSLSIQDLVAQRDWQGRRYQGGYFLTNTQDLRFAPGTDLLGLRLGTSLDTRDDLRQSSGNTIEVFLLSRGEVSLFQDGRLISTRIYDAGNQSIDTSALPGGSYNVEVRIRDSGGERFETRFYVKNSFLPPPDMPLYFVEAGEVTRQNPSHTLPSGTGEYMLRGGVNYRLNEANSLIGSLSGSGSDTATELGWFGLGRGYELRLTGALAQSQRYGAGIDLRLNYFDLFATGSYRRIWDGSGRDFEDLNLIGEEQEQAYINLSIPTTVGRFGGGARYNQRLQESAIRAFTLGYEANGMRVGPGDLRLRFDINRENGLHQAVLTAQWRTYWGRWNASITPQAIYQEYDDSTERYLRGDANLNWDSQDLWSQQLRGNVRAVRDRDFRTLGAAADWRGRYGQARYQIEQRFGDNGEDALFQNGSLATNFVLAEGGPAVGGREQNQSAIVVEITGSPELNASFDVLLNGSHRATAKADSRTVISVRPFETYAVRLRARGGDFVHFDDREHDVSLYPGNVVNLSWHASVVDIILGRVVHVRGGSPVRDGLLHGVKGLSVTDEYGLFQAEVERGTRALRLETRNGECQLDLPEYRLHQGVGSVGVLKCDLK